MPPDNAVTAPATPDVSAAAPVGVEQAEAALVEHYPRLVRIAYLVLPPSLGRNRRVLTAHALVQRSLPRGRTAAGPSGLTAPRRTAGTVAVRNPGYLYVRERVLRQALDAGRPLRRLARPRRAQLPPLLPHVWGLRLFPRSGGADELALDQRLSRMTGPARAALVLRGLDGLSAEDVRHVLGAVAADGEDLDMDAALAEADSVLTAEPPGTAGTAGEPWANEAAGEPWANGAAGAPEATEATRTAGHLDTVALLRSPEFDPCSLQARPTDLMIRRRRAKTTVAAVAAVLLCGTLLALPGGGWGPDGAAAPAYARNAAVRSALDPGRVRRIAPAAWRTSSRTDFSVWPTRGPLADDRALLRRALAVWAGPGASVHVSATPATPSGPPMGPPQLLYAGTVDGASVVLFHDGLRVVRYAEPADGGKVAALDFARVDGADDTASDALVVGRSDGNVRYLTAPWVRRTGVRDLLAPTAPARPLRRDADGVTEPLASPATARDCRSWNTLEVPGANTGDSDNGGTDRLLTDLGEMIPARLTSGPPSAPTDVAGAADRAAWARTACLLPTVRSHGVRSVNSWQYATQSLPESNGTAAWLCTRAETWRGTGSRVMAQFQAPTRKATPGAIAARAEDSPACGVRDPRVLAGVLWKSRGGQWYVLAAGNERLRSLELSGGVKGSARGNVLAARARQGADAELSGREADGTRVNTLR
ncbi:hypothetical protein ACIOJD_10450 [Streptomyces sp. NPDC088116]|uniref:hypothetical protein n=1 Tax=Streptomyces sp. NPDC088116 TaxID=3365825 RepID=UPI00381C5F22